MFKKTAQPAQIHLSSERLESIQTWFSSELGQELLTAEQDLVDSVAGQLFGYHLLQVGILPGRTLFESAPASHKFEMVQALGAEQNSEALVGSAVDLPFSSDCLDAVLLHHALDFTASPHQVLRETARVLKPGGKLVIVGFNPTSFWGLYRLSKLWSKATPWDSHFISQGRLKDWLALLALKQEHSDTGFYAPPFKRHSWRQRVSFIDRWGGRYLSACGGVYMYLATKESLAMTPLQQGWQQRLSFQLGNRTAQQAGRNTSAKLKLVYSRDTTSS